MTYVFCLLGSAFLFLFVFPYLIYPLTLKLFPLRTVVVSEPECAIRFTLLFAAYNEERSLPRKLDNIRKLKQMDPDLEIIAYCDLSSDRTLDVLREASDVLEVVAARERTGKATGMARMVAQARGDVCVFTDANVLIDEQAFVKLRRYFADPQVGGVAGKLVYTNDNESATARAGGLYWRLEEWIKALESTGGSIMGADGSIFATRRDLYPHVPPHLLDDMIVSMSAALAGKRLIYASDVVAFERNTTSTKEEFRRKRRIACRAFNTHRYLWPSIRKQFGASELYKYVSHKVLRWLGLPLLVMAVICFGIALAMSGHTGIIVGALVVVSSAVGLGYAGLPPFALGFELITAIFATFLGVVDALCGRTYQTWTPAASRDTFDGAVEGEGQSELA